MTVASSSSSPVQQLLIRGLFVRIVPHTELCVCGCVCSPHPPYKMNRFSSSKQQLQYSLIAHIYYKNVKTFEVIKVDARSLVIFFHFQSIWLESAACIDCVCKAEQNKKKWEEAALNGPAERTSTAAWRRKRKRGNELWQVELLFCPALACSALKSPKELSTGGV